MINNKPKDNSMKISLPKICARCGKEPAEDAWPIYSKYNHTFYVVLNTYTTSRFLVPVCKACKMQLDKDSARWYRVMIASGVSITVMLCFASQFIDYFNVFILLAFVALIGFFLAYIKRAKYWGGSGIASYNGRYFTFNNKDFQKQFAELNPTLVRKV